MGALGIRSIAFFFCMFGCMHSQTSFAQISSPTDISNLAFWVDAKDVNGTGTQPVNGSAVTTWVDKSSGGNNLTLQNGTVTFQQTGFDGINPGLRFPLTARMAASNPFGGTYQNEMTVFFVNSNVTLTRNFSFSLNGRRTSNNTSDGRFSFHTPWNNNDVYFDAGSSSGTARLRADFPNAVSETTLYTGLNDQPGNRQYLRVDGVMLASDMSGHNANVSRGVHVGDILGSHAFNGRFAEILVYDRALTLNEIEDVECFLLLKWKPSAAQPACFPVIDAVKTAQPYDVSGTNAYALPGNDVLYTITATHESGASLDSETLFIVDSMPPEVEFYNADIDGVGPETNPVLFSDNGSGLTFDYATDVAFSNSVTKPTDMTDCTYIPASGYDPNVTFICIKPSGIFQFGDPSPSFSVSFRARIK